jgi:hypothetical protein
VKAGLDAIEHVASIRELCAGVVGGCLGLPDRYHRDSVLTVNCNRVGALALGIGVRAKQGKDSTPEEVGSRSAMDYEKRMGESLGDPSVSPILLPSFQLLGRQVWIGSHNPIDEPKDLWPSRLLEH